MSIRGWQSKQILNPRGEWSVLDNITESNPSRAFVTKNVRFAPGKVYSREGTSIRLAAGGKITGLFNWITGPTSWVIYLDGTTIKAANVAGGAPVSLATSITARAPSVADAGTRAYIAAFTTLLAGATQCRVTDGTASATDKCFQPPLTVTSLTPSDNGVGSCTKGTHKFGLLFQSRSGFTGKPGPAPADVFTPVSFTCVAQRTIRLALTLNTPAEAGTGSSLYVIMTRADNPNKWFIVPDLSTTLPASAAAWTYNLDVSISDEDLADRAELAADFFNLLTQAVAGTGPFNPSVVFTYGKRNCYIVGNKAYFSEINDAQSVAEDRNVRQVAGQKRLVTGFSLGRSAYLLGDHWTYEFTDNGDFPATWAPPREVSAAIGTLAPLGVEWRTKGDYAWVATEPGAYVFDGSYSDKPISYLFKPWSTINWNAAYAIQVRDDVVNLRCYFAVPTGSNTEPDKLFVCDYKNGLTYDTCDWSVDDFASGAFGVNGSSLFSSVGLVQESASTKTTLWLGPPAAGSILQQDATTHNDNGLAINSYWETGWIWTPGDLEKPINRVGNLLVCVNGNGVPLGTAYGKDRVLSANLPFTPSALTSAMGYEIFSKFDLSPVEECSIRFGTNGVDYWFELNELTPYWKPVRLQQR